MPFRKSWTPPNIILVNRVKLRQIEGDDFGRSELNSRIPFLLVFLLHQGAYIVEPKLAISILL